MSLKERIRSIYLAASGKTLPTAPTSFPAEAFFPYLSDLSFAIPSVDDLVRDRGIAVYREMMDHDDMVSAVVALARLAALSSGWDVTPASDDEEDKEIAECLRYDLGRLDSGSIERMTFEILDALPIGFSIQEPVWKAPYTSGPWAGKQGYSEFLSVPQETIAIKRDAHGQIEEDGIWQAKPYSSVPASLDPSNFMKLSRSSLILFSWGTRYGNPLGLSMLRPAFPWYFIKKTAVKWWARHLEFFGLPFLMGVVGRNATAQQKSELLETLRGYQAQQRAVMTEGSKIEITEPGTSVASNHDLLINRCDRGIARAFLTPPTMLDNPEVGSYALGKEHKGTYTWFLTYARTLLEKEVFDAQIVRPFVDHNFGKDRDLPLLRFKNFSAPDLVAIGTILKILSEIGYPLPPQYIEDVTGVPMAEEGEPFVGGTAPAPPPMPDPIPSDIVEGDEGLTALALDLFEAVGTGDPDEVKIVASGNGDRSRSFAADNWIIERRGGR